MSHLFAVPFDIYIGPFQVLPLRASVELGAMAMHGYFVLPRNPVLLKPYNHIVDCHIRTLVVAWSFTPLQRCSRCILQPHPTWLSSYMLNGITNVLLLGWLGLVWFGLVPLINSISTFFGYFMSKKSSKNSIDTILSRSWRIKWGLSLFSRVLIQNRTY